MESIIEIIQKPLDQPKILEYANQNLPLQGILKQTRSRYTYLQVDDRFIYDLFPLLIAPNKQMPLYFTQAYNHVGAHITVINEEEYVLDTVDELGKQFSFIITGLHHAALELTSYFILSIESLELVKIRNQYGLSDIPIYRGIPVEFHITIAKRA